MAKKKVKKTIYQNHHIIYGDDKNKEVVRKIRKGVHAALRYIRYFNYLTDQEISTIILECEMKRKFKD